MPYKKPESFETVEYSVEHKTQDRLGAIYQIVEQMARETPTAGVRASFTGNLLKLTYHCYEMHLPRRIRQVEDQSKQVLNRVVKDLKKEYRKLRSETLELKEKKELSNTSVQKVSLNERYLYAEWRFYEIGE